MKFQFSTARFLILTTVALAFGAGCSHNPNKAEKIETKMERAQELNGEEKVGVKNGDMIVQKKVEMNEALRKLQNDVYSLEDRVYGNRKYGSQGLYGTLKACRAKLVSKEMGGDGKLMFTEPLERITDKEDEFTVGIDERDKIVGVSEEFLKDRIKRFQGYKSVLQKREDEYQEKLEICDTDLAAREHEMKKKAAKAAPAASKAEADSTGE
jgi:septin family protein